MTPIEAEFEAARTAYHDAAGRLITAILPHIAEQVRAVFPDGRSLRAFGEMGENGPILRAQCVTKVVQGVSSHALVAGWDDSGDETVEGWEELTDRIDPLLDWLIELTGDDYFGEQDFDLSG